MSRTPWSLGKVLCYTFFFGLAIRAVIILGSPLSNHHNSDLEINRMTGALVHAGVDPYDPRDHIELRAHLRDETISPTARLTQAFWDYVTASLTPLNLLYFGLTDLVSNEPLWYRFAQAAVDALYGVLAMAFVLLHWPHASRREALVSGAALGAASLVMLQWGVHSPEDKGMELLLIAAALLALYSSRPVHQVFSSALLLGLAVAFKVIAICLVPLFLVRIYTHAPRKDRVQRLVIFGVVGGAAALAWFIPFLPGFIEMSRQRLTDDTSQPMAASPFVWLGSHLPINFERLRVIERARYARIVSAAAFIIVAVIGLIRRTITLEVASASFLLLFVTTAFIAGGLDRLNIGIASAILLIGTSHPTVRRIAVAWYVALGTFSVISGYRLSPLEPRYEGLFVGIAALALLGFMARLAFRFRAPGGGVTAVAVLCAAIALTAPARADGTGQPGTTLAFHVNPFLGMWKLNLQRSTLRTTPRPRRQLLVIEDAGGGGVLVTLDTIEEGGLRYQTQYTTKYDGRESPVTRPGSSVIGAIAVTRINEYIIDFVEKDTAARATSATGTMTTSLYSNELTIRTRRQHDTRQEEIAFYNIVARPCTWATARDTDHC